MTHTYSTAITGTHAKAVGRSLSISFKQAVVITHVLRGKLLPTAKAILTRAIAMKDPIPYFRFNHNIGHRAGKQGPGRYPVQSSKAILDLLASAEANATAKGLAADTLMVSTILAQKGPRTWRAGRRRRSAKRTHVEVILTLAPPKKDDKKQPSATHRPADKAQEVGSQESTPVKPAVGRTGHQSRSTTTPPPSPEQRRHEATP